MSNNKKYKTMKEMTCKELREAYGDAAIFGDAVYCVDDMNYSLYRHNARYAYVPVRSIIESGRNVVIGRREFRPHVTQSVTSRGQAVTWIHLLSVVTQRPMRRSFCFASNQTTDWNAYFPIPVDFGEYIINDGAR